MGGTEYKSADVRLIAATSKNLKEMVDRGEFRDDLFYQLNVFPITLPPLRERKEDIPLIAWHFLKQQSQKTGKQLQRFTPEAMSLLVNAQWPGNVRELKNTIERLVITGEGNTITADDLPESLRNASVMPESTPVPRTNEELKALKKRLREAAAGSVERPFILEALKRNNWNITRAARETGIQRPNFHALMRKHGIRRQQP